MPKLDTTHYVELDVEGALTWGEGIKESDRLNMESAWKQGRRCWSGVGTLYRGWVYCRQARDESPARRDGGSICRGWTSCRSKQGN